jgi:hypothetical protein
MRDCEWRDPDSNRGHHDFQSCGLLSRTARETPGKHDHSGWSSSRVNVRRFRPIPPGSGDGGRLISRSRGSVDGSIRQPRRGSPRRLRRVRRDRRRSRNPVSPSRARWRRGSARSAVTRPACWRRSLLDKCRVRVNAHEGGERRVQPHVDVVIEGRLPPGTHPAAYSARRSNVSRRSPVKRSAKAWFSARRAPAASASRAPSARMSSSSRS